MIDYPKDIRKLNDLVRAELGTNPLYAWRWSGDLLHVMVLVDDMGRPKLNYSLSPNHKPNYDGLGEVDMSPIMVAEVDTETRLLLPNHPANWVVCALIEVNERDGNIYGTGNHSWVPVSSSNSGPVALPEGETPDLGMTQCLIDSIRKDRARRVKDIITEDEESRRKREKQHWMKIYEQIAMESAAFYGCPGKKGSTSFPSVQPSDAERN
ncbi:MAG TPA: hypothetical protein VNZ86_13625 [Bacteroidia bacterium]|jgi:hypothetical protein|nr:hypothetical protein [Bacteroidia bacterium]